MFKVTGKGVYRVSPTGRRRRRADPAALFEDRRSARQVYWAALELSEETGHSVEYIAPLLRPFIDRDVIVTPELIGLASRAEMAAAAEALRP